MSSDLLRGKGPPGYRAIQQWISTTCEAWLRPELSKPLRQKPNGMISQAVPAGDRLYPIFFRKKMESSKHINETFQLSSPIVS